MRGRLEGSIAAATAVVVVVIAGCTTTPAAGSLAPSAIPAGSEGIAPSSLPSPGATPVSTPVALGEVVLVRGWESCSTPGFSLPTPNPSGRMHGRSEITCTATFNDPRVSGTKTGPFEFDAWGSESNGAIIEWGSPRRIENEQGAWVGSWAGVYTSETGDMISIWFKGTGAYEGLSFYEWIEAPPGQVGAGYPVVGVIFPGSPPTP